MSVLIAVVRSVKAAKNMSDDVGPGSRRPCRYHATVSVIRMVCVSVTHTR